MSGEKIKVLITSGGITDVGKTTIAKHVTAYLRKLGRDAVHIGVEMAKKSLDGEDERIGYDYDDVLKINFELMADQKDVIVDVGGENFNPLAQSLAEINNGPINMFTHVIVPVAESAKEENIISTIHELVDSTIDPSRIYLVFNRVLPSQRVKIFRMFASAVSAVEELGANVVDEPIMRSQVIFAKRGLEPVFDVDDDVDAFKAEMHRFLEKGDKAGAERMAQKSIEASSAKLASANFEAVIKSIFGNVEGFAAQKA